MTDLSGRAAADLRAADRILERAADDLEALLRDAARRLRPFPPFPGALFSYGVEVEAEGVRDRSLGCVVVTETGELKELQIGFDAEGPALGPPDPGLDARGAPRRYRARAARSAAAGRGGVARRDRAAGAADGPHPLTPSPLLCNGEPKRATSGTSPPSPLSS